MEQEQVRCLLQELNLSNMEVHDLIHKIILEQISVSQALLLTKVDYSNFLSKESLDWVTLESEGYKDGLTLPKYRMLNCDVVVDITQNWGAPSSEILDTTKINTYLQENNILNSTPNLMRVSQNLESIEKSISENSGTIKMILPFGMKQMLLQWYSYPAYCHIVEMYQQCPDDLLRNIIPIVRNKLVGILQNEVANNQALHNVLPKATLEDNKKKVFISYGWDSDGHKKWVHSLADRLKEHFDVKIDVKQPFGSELNLFMEKMVAECDRVLLVLTPQYKQKADNREKGVGYESVLISDEIFNDQNTIKFIPIIRKGTKKECYPRYLGNRKGVLMTDDNAFEDILEELITDIKEN